ncbi:MAG: hypothetical protein AB7U82_27670 [Blastocatellales bacterium]
MPDYEKLQDVGTSGLQREREYPILDADFGDGYYVAIVIGDTAGVRKWTLTWSNAHRDAGPLIQAKTYNNVNIGSPTSRFQYVTGFLHRMLSAGNTPFWFEDVDNVSGLRTLTLCRLLPKTYQQRQDRRNPLIYNFSIQFQQIRGAPAQS